jgi:hypothetical protein
VWVTEKSPADGFTSVAVASGLLAFAGGTIVGGTAAVFTGKGDDGAIGAVTLGTILPLTFVPGLILMAVGTYQVRHPARTSNDPGPLLMRSNAESKRAHARTLTIVAAIISGLSTVAIAAGPPLFASCFYNRCGTPSHDVGLWLMGLSVPLSMVGAIGLGIGVHGYVKYDYPLNLNKYESMAAPALTSLRLAPYASQGGSGLLLSGAF